jgi:hypothetical protein
MLGMLSGKGKSNIVLKIDKAQYKPGEIIKLTCNIDNSESMKSISKIKVELLKCVDSIDPSTGKK